MDANPDSTNYSEQPPDNFRELTVIPTVHDIFSSGQPYLRKNLVDGDYDDVEHYLDVQFRLLREDFIRPFREAVTEYRQQIQGRKGKMKLDKGRLYSNAFISGESFTFEGALTHFIIPSFPKVDWNTTRRLQTGAMLVLSPDHFKTIVFVSVVSRGSYQSRACFLKVKVEQATNELKSGIKYNILETDAYLEGYCHVLNTLKTMNSDNLPLSESIVKIKTEECPPKYLALGTQYRIPVVTEAKSKTICILQRNSWPSADQLGLNELQKQALELALTQKLALIHGPPGTGKTHVGMVIMKSLVMNKVKISPRAPVLVLTYTNNALDQFLERIAEFTRKIIRVGSRSSSDILQPHVLSTIRKVSQKLLKISRLRSAGDIYEQRKNLSELERAAERVIVTLSDGKYELASGEHAKLAYNLINITKHLSKLQRLKLRAEINLLTEEDVNEFLTSAQRISLLSARWKERQNSHAAKPRQEEDRCHLASWLCLTPESVHLYQNVFDNLEIPQNLRGMPLVPVNVSVKQSEDVQPDGNSEPQNKILLFLVQSVDIMSSYEAQGVTDVTLMTLQDRWRLYRYWRQLVLKATESRIIEHTKFFMGAAYDYRQAKCTAEAYYVERADVLGMTTTGAAKNRDLLEKVRPVVVLVEVAAEIMEGQIVASLMPSTQHLILIGDHKQLRPKPSVQELGTKYKLDISLFERLFRNRFACVTLNIQHRMRPCMAELLVPEMYSELNHADSVTEYPNIAGMKSNMFFLRYSEMEEETNDLYSFSNVHEALFVSQLARYLLQQGYAPEQMTIITTYAAQVVQLKKHLPEREGVRICTVDSFQGEENDIVLLSLVRSNRNKSIGFLNIKNEVCVALSRARLGFFVIGNFSLMAANSDLWRSLVKKLKRQKAIGAALTLQCQLHPTEVTAVAKAEDFKQIPEGGCSLPCEYLLNCGHSCTRHCHPDDRSHTQFPCRMKCERYLCPEGHERECNRQCFETCETCPVPVLRYFRRCGHAITIRCGEDPENYVCEVKVPTLLHCEHTVDLQCGKDPNNHICTVKVHRRRFFGNDEVPCYQNRASLLDSIISALADLFCCNR